MVWDEEFDDVEIYYKHVVQEIGFCPNQLPTSVRRDPLRVP